MVGFAFTDGSGITSWGPTTPYGHVWHATDADGHTVEFLADRNAPDMHLFVKARTAHAVAALVAVVRSVVEEGHYENHPEGLMCCTALCGSPAPTHEPDPRCDCGWNEAAAALALWDALDPPALGSPADGSGNP